MCACQFCSSLQLQSSFLKTWKSFFFELRECFLIQYNEKEIDSNNNNNLNNNLRRNEVCRIQLTNSTEIKKFQSISFPMKNKKFAFSIKPHSNERTYVFAAETEDLMNQWMNQLELAKSKINEKKVCFSQRTQKKTNISFDDFQLIAVLGRGTYGKVTLVKHKESGVLFAMKSMSKAILAESQNIEQILQERDVLLQNQHPFLVAAHYTFQNDTKIFLIMDYVPGGELYHRLNEESYGLGEERSKLYICEIALAIGHLHKHGFVYRDLKPENILIDAEGHLKITDFGYTKKVSNNSKSDGDDFTSSTMSTFCGTPDYLAPEVVLGQEYERSVDWWALGVILYEMLTGISPFYHENLQEMYQRIISDDVEFPNIFYESIRDSDKAEDLIKNLLQKDPRERLGYSNDIDEIKNHPYFKDVDWKAVFERRTDPQWKPEITEEVEKTEFNPDSKEEIVGVSFEDPALVPEEAQKMFENFTYTDNSLKSVA